MEKYTKAQMEVIEFENEDVVTVSIPIENCPSMAVVKLIASSVLRTVTVRKCCGLSNSKAVSFWLPAFFWYRRKDDTI